MTKGLTAKIVRSAPAGDKTHVIWDNMIVGLGLRITANNARSYILNYRCNGRQRRLTLGRASGDPPELNLVDARKKAGTLLQKIRDGVDPLEDRRARIEAPTVSEGLKRFETEYIASRLKIKKMAARTASEYRGMIERTVRPKLGKSRIEDVKRADIERAVADLKPVARNRMIQLCSLLFNQFERYELRSQNSNPAKGIEKAREEARDRTFSADELRRLSIALDHESINEFCALAIRLSAITGLRSGEVRNILWRDVDLETARLLLPETKTGRRVHSLPSPAIALLKDAKRVGKFVIAGLDSDKPMNKRTVSRAFEKARKLANVEGVTQHDLRRTVMTGAAESGASAHLIRDLVGHKSAQTADKYVREAGAPLIELRERIGSQIAKAMAGGGDG